MPFRNTALETARVTFVLDGIALEPNETFDILLQFVGTQQPPDGDNYFFINKRNLVILDVDGKRCSYLATKLLDLQLT